MSVATGRSMATSTDPSHHAYEMAHEDRDDGHYNFSNYESMDDLQVTPSLLQVDYDKNLTALYQAITDQNWDKAIRVSERDPIQAATWVVRHYQDENNSYGSSPLDDEDEPEIMWRFLPLHSACARQPPSSVISALLKAYPDAAKCVDDQGMYALHYACGNQAPPAAIRELLVSYPHAALKQDPRGMLPLHYLACWGPSHKSVVDMLLVASKDKYHSRDMDGNTPYDLASQGDYPEARAVVDALRKWRQRNKNSNKNVSKSGRNSSNSKSSKADRCGDVTDRHKDGNKKQNDQSNSYDTAILVNDDAAKQPKPLEPSADKKSKSETSDAIEIRDAAPIQQHREPSPLPHSSSIKMEPRYRYSPEKMNIQTNKSNGGSKPPSVYSQVAVDEDSSLESGPTAVIMITQNPSHHSQQSRHSQRSNDESRKIRESSNEINKNIVDTRKIDVVETINGTKSKEIQQNENENENDEKVELHSQLHEQANELAMTQQKLASTLESLAGTQDELHDVRAQLQETQQQLRESQSECTGLRSTLGDMMEEHETIKKQSCNTYERLTSLTVSLQSMREQQEWLSSTVSARNEKYMEVMTKRRELFEQLVTLDEAVEENESKLDASLKKQSREMEAICAVINAAREC